MPCIPVIDLFAGPGGLGEGFSSASLKENPFRIAVSIEKDPVAHRTLVLRAFFRQFKQAGRQVPEKYYRYLTGEITRAELETAFPAEWSAAQNEALCAELGNPKTDHQPLIDKTISDAVGGKNNWLLIGGPPCQAFSLVGRSRMLGALKDKSGRLIDGGEAFFADHRHRLYQQYLRIIAMYGPAVFVMENVKGILSAKLNGERIFPRILADLRDPSVASLEYKKDDVVNNTYRIISFVTGEEPKKRQESEYLIKAEEYGIPQARHRVILLGIREDFFSRLGGKIIPLRKSGPIRLKEVIGNLPPLRSGFSKGPDSIERWKEYFRNLESAAWIETLDSDLRKELLSYIQELGQTNLERSYAESETFPLNAFNHWYFDKSMKGLLDHATRSHVDNDLARYLFVAAYGKAKGKSPHLKDFPTELLPNHRNVNINSPNQKFSDRFKVQVWDRPASTITSHISKDGHYFIHPDPAQCRSLTVREAARLQTFPDNYFFEGGRTQQYHQVGNAVPPLLANQLAEIVLKIFRSINA